MTERLTALLEITAPVSDVTTDGAVERLALDVRLEGASLGVIELPVFDGRVHAAVIRDAIADRFAWRLLGAFFERGVYAGIALRDEGATRSADRHDTIGWSTLLDELVPPGGSVLDAAAHALDRLAVRLGASATGRAHADGRWTVVELSEPVTSRVTGTRGLLAEVRVGGVPVMAVPVAPGVGGVISGARLRSEAIDRCGFELCRVVVREAIIGAPLEGGSLRQRLVAAARRAGDRISDAAPDALVLSNRAPMRAGTSASRRATLPSACAPLLRALSASTGVPFAEAAAGDVRTVVYAPDALWRDTREPRARGQASPPRTASGANEPARAASRLDFESLFAAAADPWRYGSDYEQTKYEQTLDLLPDAPIARALEIACAEGHFTRQLAPRVGSLLATDISEVALGRAAERCAAASNVVYRQLDLATDALPGAFDLIVCSEVLYYVCDRDGLPAVARTIVDALEPGGHFLTAHAHVLADAPAETGFDWDVPFGARHITEVFSAVPGLRLVRELRTPLYRVLLFRRDALTPAQDTPPAELVETDHYAAPTAEAAEHIRWGGGEVRRAPKRRDTTSALPILMYHHVAPDGDPSRRRWRTDPASFERQLRYLRESGHRSVTLDEWRDAALVRRPLDGRAVLLTFDDGFADFSEHAWPLLQEYGFGALVFVVAGLVGRGNEWDGPVTAATEPLMDWSTLARLRDAGVELGAHTMTHPHLATLAPTAMVEQIAGSRALMAERLGIAPEAFAYPYGDQDDVVRHVAGACGVAGGFLAGGGRAGWNDSFLALPRLEVDGRADLAAFIAMLAR